MNTIIKTINDRGGIVVDAFKHVLEFNTSLYAPYHNMDHLLWVTQKCYEGALYENLDSRQTDKLLVAALFHDFNHTMGESSDDVNIKFAVNGFRDFFMDVLKSTDGEFMGDVVDIIRATEYPYVISEDILTIEQKIIRDADLMQAISDNWFGMIMLGLSKEAKGAPLNAVVEGNIKFHKGVKMITEWGQRMYEIHWPDLFQNMDALKSMYKK